MSGNDPRLWDVPYTAAQLDEYLASQATEKRRSRRDADLDFTAPFVSPPGEPMPNARRFLVERFKHPEHALLVYQGGVFYSWNGTCWPTLDDKELRARLYTFFEKAIFEMETKTAVKVEPFAPNRYKVADLEDALKAVAHIAVTTLAPSWLPNSEHAHNAADELISCRNGLVHWPTRTLYPHTPTFYSHHSVDFAFDVEAEVPTRWHAFLNELWGEDLESIETLQEIFGYIISGDTRLQKAFMVVGPKRSGKGTIARVLKAMLGGHNIAAPTLAGIATNFGLQPLIGKPVAIIADARLKAADTSIVTERLLSISGEDTLTVDRKYLEPWTGQLPSRIVLLSNELPRLSDSSGALASRFIILSMKTSFYGRENINLTDELIVELPGIFNWALDGLERLRARGRFIQPASSLEAMQEMYDLGSPIGAFVRDECQLGPEYTVSCDQLYNAWKEWCSAAGRSHPSNAQTFGRDLRAVVPGLRLVQPRNQDGSRYRAYTGIALARSGTRSTPLYRPESKGNGDARTQYNNEPDRVPSRATCPKCAGEGCGWCGDTGRNSEIL